MRMNKEAALNIITLMSMAKQGYFEKDARLLPMLAGVGLLGGVPFALAKIEKAKREAAEKAQKEMMQVWGPFIQGLIGQRGNIGYQEAVGRMAQ